MNEIDRPQIPRPEIDGFVIQDEIGRGGMGVVYLARQTKLDRLVALKVLIAAHHASADQLQRFQDEARNLGGLQHPGIVQIFDVGSSHGLPYLAMEYLSAGSLAQRIAHEPFSYRQAAEMVRDLAQAVHAAHEPGIVHRDLKPANILLTLEGKPKITDFGVAKNLAAADSLTRTGDVMGTPDYMAPEQAGGVTKSISPRVDVYSLGAILYELLTGRPPFRGFDPVETLMAVLTEDPVMVRRLAPRVPRDLETICHKCLQKNGSRRYSSAQELASDLGRFLEGRAITARRITAVGKAWRWARRRPAWATLISVALFSVISFIAFATWKNQQLSRALGETRAALDRSSRNFREAIAAAARRIQRHGDPQIDPLREELAFFEAIRSTPDDSSLTTRWEKALAANWAGAIYARMGATAQAEQAFRESIRWFESLLDDMTEQQSPVAIDLAQTEGRLSNFLISEGRLDEAQRWQQRAIDRLEHEQLQLPMDVEILRALGAEYNNLAVIHRKLGEDPVPTYRQSMSIRRLLIEAYPAELIYQYDLALLQVNLAALHISQGRYDEAEALLGESLISLEHFVQHRGADDEARRTLTSCQLNLALVYSLQERHGDSDQAYRSAIDRLRQWLQHNPRSVELRLLMVDGLDNWFLLKARLEKWLDLKNMLTEIRDLQLELVREFPEEPAYRAGLERTLERMQFVEEELQEIDRSLP